MALESSEAARVLAARRQLGPVVCEECGKALEATRRRRYCSNTCNVRAWRRNHPAGGPPSESVGLDEAPLTPGAPRAEKRLATRMSVGLIDGHTAAWWQSQAAIANVRASLARLDEAAARGVPRRPKLDDFIAAGRGLREAMARHAVVVAQGRAALAAARASMPRRERT